LLANGEGSAELPGPIMSAAPEPRIAVSGDRPSVTFIHVTIVLAKRGTAERCCGFNGTASIAPTDGAPRTGDACMSDLPEDQSLLTSARTEGLEVRSRDGDRMGHVDAYMVDKRSGQVTYAVLSLGGFLGMGKSYYPLPFALLTYDPGEDGYLVNVDRRVLEGGPSWANNPPAFNQAYADRVSSYYGAATVNVSSI
jgi:hypothetical protein